MSDCKALNFSKEQYLLSKGYFLAITGLNIDNVIQELYQKKQLSGGSSGQQLVRVNSNEGPMPMGRKVVRLLFFLLLFMLVMSVVFGMPNTVMEGLTLLSNGGCQRGILNAAGYAWGAVNPVCAVYDKIIYTMVEALKMNPVAIGQITAALGAVRYAPRRLLSIADDFSDTIGLPRELDDGCAQDGLIGYDDIRQQQLLLRDGSRNADDYQRRMEAAQSLLDLGGQHTPSLDGGTRKKRRNKNRSKSCNRNTRKRNTRKRNTRKRK